MAFHFIFDGCIRVKGRWVYANQPSRVATLKSITIPCYCWLQLMPGRSRFLPTADFWVPAATRAKSTYMASILAKRNNLSIPEVRQLIGLYVCLSVSHKGKVNIYGVDSGKKEQSLDTRGERA